MDENISFGGWLRRRRSALGLTREGLGRRVGLSVSAIRKLESDERRPSRETAERLAEELGISSGDRGTFVRVARSELRVEALPPPLLLDDRAPEARDGLSFQPRQTLPTPLTSFVGREGLIEWIESTLLEDVRLLTLTGPGGVGKTRLSLEVARRATDHFPDGVWFVDLSPIVDPGLVLPAVARVLGLAEVPGRPILASLKGRLQGARALLVLDNFEQVAGAASLVAELLAACPRLTALVTSRALLRVSGERHVPVPPLRAPGVDEQPDADSLLRYDAVRLFMERASALAPDVVLPGPNAPVVAEICRRLDGLPLALELAAARSTMLSLPEMLSRLEDRLGLLTGGARDLPERQQTMRATIEWSHELLEEEEERLYRRLGVFAGGFTLEAAESVCGDGEPDVLDVLSGLVDSSLVRQRERVAGGLRFRMLETVREYAEERLQESGEAEQVRRRHVGYFLALAQEAEPELRGARQGEWLARLEAEHDNLRAALSWSLEGGDRELGLRLAGSLWFFWHTRGHWSEGRRWLEGALAGAEAALPAARARALLGLGVLALWLSDHGRAEVCLRESLALCRALGDERGISAALSLLGVNASTQGDWESAGALWRESLALARDAGDEWAVARDLGHLGRRAQEQGDYGRATDLFGEGRALTRKLGDRAGLAGLLLTGGQLQLIQGDHEAARERLEESLGIAREIGDTMLAGYALGNLGVIALELGDRGRAGALVREALELFRGLGERYGISIGLDALGGLAAAEGRGEEAARLLGAGYALRERSGVHLQPEQRSIFDRYLAAARSLLGVEAFEAAWAAGRAMGMEEAVAYALAGGKPDAAEWNGRV